MEKSNRRLQEVQQTVNEVTDIMHDNLTKVDERSEKLSDLDTRAELLRAGSKKFSKTAVKVKKKKRWENQKMKLLLGGVVLVVVVVAIIIIAVVSSDNSSSQETLSEVTNTNVGPTETVSQG